MAGLQSSACLRVRRETVPLDQHQRHIACAAAFCDANELLAWLPSGGTYDKENVE